ncbi:MAG: hypothetical protein PHZ19_05485 [Candidatus Thermoplasmatota archaeon]|nr:hypothetical protein [Candidatus Thermoplasmatota archaeon]
MLRERDQRIAALVDLSSARKAVQRLVDAAQQSGDLSLSDALLAVWDDTLGAEEQLRRLAGRLRRLRV